MADLLPRLLVQISSPDYNLPVTNHINMRQIMRRGIIFLSLTITILLAGCKVAEDPTTDLFPGAVGDYFRISGPTPDPDTGVDVAIYQSAEGNIRLNIKWVGADQVGTALSELPPNAENVGYQEALGPRNGVFFTFGGGYHAAWGNDDWVFVISADTEAGRRNFLAFYGF